MNVNNLKFELLLKQIDRCLYPSYHWQSLVPNRVIVPPLSLYPVVINTNPISIRLVKLDLMNDIDNLYEAISIVLRSPRVSRSKEVEFLCLLAGLKESRSIVLHQLYRQWVQSGKDLSVIFKSNFIEFDFNLRYHNFGMYKAAHIMLQHPMNVHLKGRYSDVDGTYKSYVKNRRLDFVEKKYKFLFLA